MGDVDVPRRVWLILYAIAFALFFGTTSGIAIGIFGLSLQTVKVISILLAISIVSMLIAMPINRLLWNSLRELLQRPDDDGGR